MKHRALEKVLNQITSILLTRLRLSFLASIAPIPAQRVTKNGEKKSDESPRDPEPCPDKQMAKSYFRSLRVERSPSTDV